MDMVNFELSVTDGSKTEKLLFKLRDHATARKWGRCLWEACEKSQLLEKDRWYNFTRHKYGSAEKIAEQINQSIARLNLHHAGLITDTVDPRRLQESINSLHVHFADNHLVSRRITPQSAPHWRDFNNHLHAYEAWERNEVIKKATGRNETRSIIFTWEDNQKKPLADEDYQHFTVGKVFGACYVNYCQVGRHFYELYQSQDSSAKDEHILPLRWLSADTYIWFGSTTGKKALEKRSKDLESWFKKNETRFNRLGYHWGDPRLAIGWLPVADLDMNLSSQEDQTEFLEWLSQFKEVCGCHCR